LVSDTIDLIDDDDCLTAKLFKYEADVFRSAGVINGCFQLYRLNALLFLKAKRGLLL